jgi:predicted transcriptional regulator
MADVKNEQDPDLQALAAQVAAAYFRNSHVPAAEIPTVIAQIAQSLAQIGPSRESADPSTPSARATTAQVRKSITPDGLISFEDGKRYKTLRRHLSVRGLAPEQYREKWGLPHDYPMVSPNYSATRSAMAKALGLGQKGQQGRKRRAATK